MEAISSARYSLVRALCCPMPLLPQTTPFFGGKSFLELLISLAIWAVIAAMLAVLSEGGRGQLADYVGAITVLFALRKVAVLSLVGIPFERGLYWHKVLAVCFLVALLAHGVAEGYNTTGVIVGVVAGVISLAYLLAYWGVSFNAFYAVHVLGYAVIAPVVIIHGGKFTGFFSIIWGADLLVRYLVRGRGATATLSRATSDVVKISLPSPFKGAFEPGQYCFLMVPAINGYEYHPFSIASAPSDDELVFFVKAAGDWTNKLLALTAAATDGGEAGGACTQQVYLEGPYGKLCVDEFNGNVYAVAILVSGGVGVTPMLSMLRHFLQSDAAALQGFKKVVFVWSLREQQFADAVLDKELEPLIAKYLVATDSPSVYTLKDTVVTVEFHIHVTQKKRTNVNAPARVAAADANDNEVEMLAKNSNTEFSSKSMKEGRPDMNRIFKDAVKTTVQDKQPGTCGGALQRVSVSVCGPKPLVDSMRNQRASFSGTSGVVFDLHEELFNF